MDSLHVNEEYSGSGNEIQMEAEYQNSFICRFENVDLYPFDEEECYIKLECSGHDSRFVNLVPGLLRIIPVSFGQYKVLLRNTTLTQKDKSHLKIHITFGRNFLSIFLVTYLPTILMNIINQATNYINASSKYDNIFTMNITCMMVLSGVYLSVSTSLPTTATIKPVEVWLLFNLAYPFLVIMVNIVLQVRALVYAV